MKYSYIVYVMRKFSNNSAHSSFLERTSYLFLQDSHLSCLQSVLLFPHISK